MCHPYGWAFGSKILSTWDPFSADFWVGFPEIGKKSSKMGSFPPKFIIKVGMTATVRN